ncbi:hypothetical protein DWV69_05715 [Clostridium sp. AF12-19]|nr:hypothetical protein DWV71_12915 [Clostridium sp. AF12-28]RHS28907.1 hypothetical protein DWV69_05715 [Clostridium sp. AF12-19]
MDLPPSVFVLVVPRKDPCHTPEPDCSALHGFIPEKQFMFWLSCFPFFIRHVKPFGKLFDVFV